MIVDMATALGFRIKTGFAIAVLVESSSAATRVLERRIVALSSPDFAASKAPYHAALELPEPRAADVIKRAVAAVRDTSRKEMAKLLGQTSGVRSATLVVGSL